MSIVRRRINLIRFVLSSSCPMLYSVLLCSILFCSILLCLVTSCLVLCHGVLTRIELFLRFVLLFHTLCHSTQCTIVMLCCATLHNAPSIHFYTHTVPKTYLTVVFLYIHWSITSYIRSTTRHGACVTLLTFVSSAKLLCSLSLHFCHFQVTKCLAFIIMSFTRRYHCQYDKIG